MFKRFKGPVVTMVLRGFVVVGTDLQQQEAGEPQCIMGKEDLHLLCPDRYLNTHTHTHIQEERRGEERAPSLSVNPLC